MGLALAMSSHGVQEHLLTFCDVLDVSLVTKAPAL